MVSQRIGGIMSMTCRRLTMAIGLGLLAAMLLALPVSAAAGKQGKAHCTWQCELAPMGSGCAWL